MVVESITGVWSDGRVATYRGIKKGALKYSATVFGDKGVSVAGIYGHGVPVKGVVPTIDVLVNNAGITGPNTTLWEYPLEGWQKVFAVNVDGVFHCCRAVVPVMLKQSYGSIINVASKAAFDHAAGAAAYAASKAAAIAMMDSLAADLKGTGVRVNSIVPSIIDTEANRKAMPKADFAKWPKPEDIARVVLFLCGDDAKVVHGASIPVYGDS